VQQLGSSGPALFYVVSAPGVMSRVVQAAQANPGAPPDVSLWSLDPEAFGACAPAATLVLDASAYAAQKIAALRCHRTQVGDASALTWLTDEQARELLGHEFFVRAAVGFGGLTFLDTLHTHAVTSPTGHTRSARSYEEHKGKAVR
jgi:LmbE family N-acetylglucosaminyl deacetylase